MNNILSFSNVNWLSVIVATLAAFLVGSLWYSLMFGKTWQREVKLTDEQIKDSNMIAVFVITFILEFIAAVFLDMFIGPDSNTGDGIVMGLIVSIAWIASSIGTNYLFARKSLKLFLIDAGYFVTFFVIMGAILGGW